eukprot:2135699-Pyramimonas_sp.AAC.1
MASARVWLGMTCLLLANAAPAHRHAEFATARQWARAVSRRLVTSGVPGRLSGHEDTLPMLDAASTHIWNVIHAIPRT